MEEDGYPEDEQTEAHHEVRGHVETPTGCPLDDQHGDEDNERLDCAHDEGALAAGLLSLQTGTYFENLGGVDCQSVDAIEDTCEGKEGAEPGHSEVLLLDEFMPSVNSMHILMNLLLFVKLRAFLGVLEQK